MAILLCKDLCHIDNTNSNYLMIYYSKIKFFFFKKNSNFNKLKQIENLSFKF